MLGKISNVRASVDNKAPKRFAHFSQTTANSPARKIKNPSRKREIELENNALIQKMLNIMQVNSLSLKCIFREVSRQPMYLRSKDPKEREAYTLAVLTFYQGEGFLHTTLRTKLTKKECKVR